MSTTLILIAIYFISYLIGCLCAWLLVRIEPPYSLYDIFIGHSKCSRVVDFYGNHTVGYYIAGIIAVTKEIPFINTIAVCSCLILYVTCLFISLFINALSVLFSPVKNFLQNIKFNK